MSRWRHYVTLRNNRTTIRATSAALGLGVAFAVLGLLVVSQSAAIGSVPEATPTPVAGIFNAYRTVSPPQIDGNLSEWPGDGAVLLNPDTAFSL